MKKALILIIAIWLIARFIFLDQAPQGFYIDESVRAAAVLCVSETGADSAGNTYPLFAKLPVGDACSPAQLYLSAIWIKIFGNSVSAFRAISAAVIIGTIFGIALLAKLLGGAAFALLASLLAATSPWAFQFSRIYWDAPWCGFFIVWGLYFLLKSGSIRHLFLSSACLALAAYSYPPARMYVPAAALIIIVLCRAIRPFSVKAAALWLFSLGFMSLPLIVAASSPEQLERFNALRLDARPDLVSRGLSGDWLTLLKEFAENLLKHLDPRFLLLWGDKNLRHSTREFGVFGWLEIFALLLTVIYSLILLFRRGNQGARPIEQRKVIFCLFLLALLCFVPPAFTWEGLPHALRSFTGWIFFPLFMAIGLDAFLRWQPRAHLYVVLLSAIWTALYFQYYFFVYPSKSYAWFHSRAKSEAAAWHERFAQGQNPPLSSIPPKYGYWLLTEGKARCQ